MFILMARYAAYATFAAYAMMLLLPADMFVFTRTRAFDG